MSAQAQDKHPLAGQQMTGADMILQVLAQEGVDTVFGYSGGAILPTYDAVFRYNEDRDVKEQINLVVPANEQGAGFMAAGYARASGKVGVFMVTSGPAATNCVTPIRDCMADSVPCVLLCGQVARAAIGTDAFQEAPVYSIMSSCAKHVFLVSDPTELEATVRTAFFLARTGRPGPVVIDLPKDVQNYVGTFAGEGMLHFSGYETRLKELDAATVSTEQCTAFVEMLSTCHRPLIYAGGGVITGEASDELRAFSKQHGIPVVTTLMGIGSVDTSDALALHMLGMHGAAYANYAVEDCDLLISVGARFDDRVAGNVKEFASHAQIAHIDIDAAEIGKVKGVDWSCVGPAKQILTALAKCTKVIKKDFGEWQNHVAALKKKHAFGYKTDTDLVQPQYVLEQLSDITRGNAIVCTGVGQHQMYAAQYIDYHSPRTFITSGSMGTMGFGLPAAIGAQMACPDKIVVDVDGDGSLRMNIGELETATTYETPIKILLINNLGDGMVRQWQHLFFDRRFSGTDKSLHKKDFVKAAEADGYGFARRVETKAEVRQALEEFIAFDGPAFLEVMTDREAHVYPMVGPGLGYSDMMTGPYIATREKEHAADGTLETSDGF